jgi:hypothetical protein
VMSRIGRGLLSKQRRYAFGPLRCVLCVCARTAVAVVVRKTMNIRIPIGHNFIKRIEKELRVLQIGG